MSNMKYVVEYRFSRTQLWNVWSLDNPIKELDKAIEIATQIWKSELLDNAYVDIRIGKQHK